MTGVDEIYALFLKDLREGRPFAFARYGDGEWSCILGKPGKNCDGHEYFPDLGEALSRCLREGLDYFYGLQPLACNLMWREMAGWMVNNLVNLPWINADVLHEMNKKERLAGFLGALAHLHCTLVGPTYLRKLQEVHYDYFVEVPEVNAWLAHYEIRKTLWTLLDASECPACVLFCCGPMAKVLIHETFRKYGSTTVLIDVGSAFDLFVGRGSRRYIRSMLEARK